MPQTTHDTALAGKLLHFLVITACVFTYMNLSEGTNKGQSCLSRSFAEFINSVIVKSWKAETSEDKLKTCLYSFKRIYDGNIRRAEFFSKIKCYVFVQKNTCKCEVPHRPPTLIGDCIYAIFLCLCANIIQMNIYLFQIPN